MLAADVYDAVGASSGCAPMPSKLGGGPAVVAFPLGSCQAGFTLGGGPRELSMGVMNSGILLSSLSNLNTDAALLGRLIAGDRDVD